MKKGSIIYKKFKKYKSLDEMNNLQWFALTNDYGTVYGDITKKYNFKKDPKLLDIGDGKVREMIEEVIEPHDSKIIQYSDPDEQYSGGPSNKRYHNLVQTYFGDEYDGTIIDSAHLKGSSKYPEDLLEGPTEIVLWKDFPLLLEEENNGGKKNKCSKKNKNSKKIVKKTKIKTKKRNLL
jgi:hypothetical protein